MTTLFVLFAAAVAATAVSAQSMPPGEYEVKAAFLYHFGQFVEWPSSAFEGNRAPFRICLLGDDPFGPILDDELGAKTIFGRIIHIERMRRVTASSPCQVLYIGASEGPRVTDDLAALEGSRTLTVSDVSGFTDGGGMISFILVGNKVHFIINQAAANKAGLKISSQLLNLATKVLK